MEALDEGRHRLRLGGRQTRRGLVQQQEPGRAGEGEADLELTLLTVREIAHDGGGLRRLGRRPNCLV